MTRAPTLPSFEKSSASGRLKVYAFSPEGPVSLWIYGNDAADVLTEAAQSDDEPSIFVGRLTEAKRIIHQFITFQHLDSNVTRGCAPPPVLEARIDWGVRALLHQLRTSCGYKWAILHRFGCVRDTTFVLCDDCKVI